jgi:hypothetical protein
MKLTQISTSACSTIYQIDGIPDVQLRLFIITGGTPALEFTDYSFCERYPSLEKWANKHYCLSKDKVTHCYIHQDPNNLQGPTVDDFPNGIQTVIDFIDKHLPLRALRIKRHSALPINVIKSKRVLDKQEHTYVSAAINMSMSHYISPVVFNSAVYGGRCEEKIVLFPEWWKKAQKLLNNLFDANKNWEDLTEEQYQSVYNLLNEYVL